MAHPLLNSPPDRSDPPAAFPVTPRLGPQREADPVSLKLSLDLPEDGSYLPLTRHFGRGLLKFMKVLPEDIYDVETIVAELIGNVTRHVRSAEGRFQVVLDYVTDLVVITVTDTGQGFSPAHVSEIGTLRPDLIGGGERLGGFGIPLVEALSDHLEFTRTDPHGTTARAEKCLHYETPGNAKDAHAVDKLAA